MLVTVFVSIASTVLLLFGVAGLWALFAARNTGAQPAPDVASTGYLEELAARIASLELTVSGLPTLWEEERDRALKHANRAYASEKRARELIEGDPDETLEEEDQRLLDLDAFRSEQVDVHALPEGVDTLIDPDLKARANAALGYV